MTSPSADPHPPMIVIDLFEMNVSAGSDHFVNSPWQSSFIPDLN
jgi:hypothetical protein